MIHFNFRWITEWCINDRCALQRCKIRHLFTICRWRSCVVSDCYYVIFAVTEKTRDWLLRQRHVSRLQNIPQSRQHSERRLQFPCSHRVRTCFTVMRLSRFLFLSGPSKSHLSPNVGYIWCIITARLYVHQKPRRLLVAGIYSTPDI